MKSAVFLLLIGATVLGHARHNDEGCPREECHRGQPRPKFLHHVGIKARREYFHIVRSGETIANQDEQILDWAKKYGVEEEVEEYNNKTASYVEELKQNVTNLIAELPTALEAFLNITQNKDQTRMEMKKALREMRVEGFEVFDALKADFKVFKPNHCLHHRCTDSQSSEELVDDWMDLQEKDDQISKMLDAHEDFKIMQRSGV